MRTVPIELAEQLERAEAMVWQDMVDAAPQHFIQDTGLSMDLIAGNTCISCAGIPFVHFNCAIGFGTRKRVVEKELDGLISHYQHKKSPLFLFAVQGLHEYIEPILMDRGFVPAGRWERLFRDNRELRTPGYRMPQKWTIKRVNETNAETWADFVSNIYEMPVTKDWLLNFAIRESWSHYLLEEAGKIIAVRSMYKGPDNFAFLGIEAPIPGIMTTNYQMDTALLWQIIKDGLKEGVKRFVADIEMVDEQGATPAYANAQMLGFLIPYRRLLYKKMP